MSGVDQPAKEKMRRNLPVVVYRMSSGLNK
jgi:hypothetical protein